MTTIHPGKTRTNDSSWRSIYTLGCITTVLALAGIIADVVLGMITGGNLSALPQTAVERFAQFREHPLLGLYNLDLLNIINQLFLLPGYFALYAAHRKADPAHASLSLLIFLAGSIIFVTTNTALPMLDLSHQYAAATTETQKFLLAAAGEAMLARGAHGSPGVLIGFVLPNVGSLMMSVVMLKGKIFSKTTAYAGIAGSTLLLMYLFLVTFTPAKTMATAMAMPGGLLSITWMILFSARLFQLGKLTES